MSILFAVIVVFFLGLVAFIMLSAFSKIFAVKEDPLKIEIRKCLPGINCGACGYNGCDDYAEAVAQGVDRPSRCIPGGQEVSNQISELLGVEPEVFYGVVAVVGCNGNCDATFSKAEYHGIPSCKAANMLFGGTNSCEFGCLGYGDCATACPNDAICMNNGVAHVDPRKCMGCRLCVKTCPKKIISMVPQSAETVVICNNTLPGGVARKACKNACIGCKKCEKTCETNAIFVKNNLATIDYTVCTNCGECVKACPTGCLKTIPAVK